MSEQQLPTFDQLADVAGNGPAPGCGWIWGKDDEVGTLNLLTPDRVAAAARSEIQFGMSCALNWEMTKNLRFPPTFRCHTRLDIKDTASSGTFSHDDELTFNPQSGSQIDGLRHYAHQPTRTYYNGVKHEDITSGAAGTRNGIHAMSKRGGIVGRGILLDFKAWADRRGISYSPVERFAISIDQLEQVANEQGVEFQAGDILIVRTGFVAWHDGASDEEVRTGIREGPGFVGVEGGLDAAKWLWNHHFSMVAGDTMAFEAWPPRSENGISLHEYMIALWGMPIGELWDLEALAETCQKLKRWSFFFTSAPLNVEGGVSSPPNALCIF